MVIPITIKKLNQKKKIIGHFGLIDVADPRVDPQRNNRGCGCCLFSENQFMSMNSEAQT